MASSSTTRQEVDDADSSNGSDDESVNLLENLVLDVKVPGRVALTRPVENDDELFSFAAFRGVLSELHPDILLDCKRAFTATTVDDAADAEAAENGISSGETYWVSAVRHESEEVARCGLEHLATEIFDFHVRRLGLKSGINFDPARSGAEWWTQYIEGDAEIGFHFDKDFTAEEETGLDIFPHLATVTYLTAGLGAQNKQAPTIILDHSIGPPKPVDEADNAGVGFPSPYASSGTGVRRAWLSSPSPGKHICFNGRHLHGAADVLARCFSGQEGGGGAGGGSSSSVEGPKSKRQKTPSSASSSSDSAESPPRVTFLVNLWFNWKPLGCDPLPDTAVAAMTLGSKGNKVCFQNPDQAQLPTFDWPSMKKVDGRTDKDNKKGKKSKGKQKARKEELSEDETADEAQTVMRRHFNQRGRKHVLELPLPRGIPTDDDDDSSSDDESEEDAVGGAELPWALEAGESAELVFLESSVLVVCLEESGDEDDGGEDSSEDDEESEEDEDDEDDGPDDLKKVALIECMIESVSGATGSKRKRARRKAAALISECHFDEATVECCRTAAGQATNAIKNGGGAAEDGSAVQNDDTSGEDEEDNNGSERGGADGQVGFEDVD